MYHLVNLAYLLHLYMQKCYKILHLYKVYVTKSKHHIYWGKCSYLQ